MPESCPLGGRATWRPDISEVCRSQCYDFYDAAVQKNETAGEYDIYRMPEDIDDSEGCKHDSTSLQFSSEGLQSVDASSLRLYAIVDECSACGSEFGEQVYQFNCPFNNLPAGFGEEQPE